MMTHTCKICGTKSDASKFYAGVNNKCKECHKAMVRKNRAVKADYYRAYDAKRFQDDPRVKERHQRYRKTEAGVMSVRRSQKKWEEQNPNKKAAHVILNNAVRDGRKLKPDKCESCGNCGRIHGHHDDYTKPLDVKWLCQKCHWKEHTR